MGFNYAKFRFINVRKSDFKWNLTLKIFKLGGNFQEKIQAK